MSPLWYHKKAKIKKLEKENKKQRRRYPDINTGDWMITMEKQDGHGFWVATCEASPKLFKKLITLMEKESVVFKDFYSHEVSEPNKHEKI